MTRDFVYVYAACCGFVEDAGPEPLFVVGRYSGNRASAARSRSVSTSGNLCVPGILNAESGRCSCALFGGEPVIPACVLSLPPLLSCLVIRFGKIFRPMTRLP